MTFHANSQGFTPPLRHENRPERLGGRIEPIQVCKFANVMHSEVHPLLAAQFAYPPEHSYQDFRSPGPHSVAALS